MGSIRWHKKCPCGNYIPNEYNRCDNCLLKDYGLQVRDLEEYGEFIDKEEGLRALREAEKGAREEES